MPQPVPDASQHQVTRRTPTVLISVLAFATGASIANLYYAQPLVASIAREIGISPDLAGSVVSVTQIAYGLGLFLLVSLADLIENKRLVRILLSIATLGLIVSALSSSATIFFAASFLVGLCSVAAQVLLPYIAHLVPEERRGRVVGNVMAGVLSGIMLARPIALFIAGSFGWRSVFWFSAVLMIAIILALSWMMPRHEPRNAMGYHRILTSMVRLFRDSPILQRRAMYQALMFGAFNMFWTAVPLLLADRFGLSQHGIALFALAGAGGALAAPFAGRLADRGLIRITSAGTMIVLGLSFYGARWAASGMSLIALALLAVLIDGAVQGNQVVSQRIIFSGPAATRGRTNAIYMTMQFAGGAIGSVLGTVTYERGGWTATATAGGIVAVITLLLFATESRSGKFVLKAKENQNENAKRRD
jgi:predicted MFS family arabinose efflux permease